MTKKVITVCGEIDPGDLGITLPHEHLLFDLRCYWSGEPVELSRRELFSQPVSLSNRGEVIYNKCCFLDNLYQGSTKVAIEEVMEFRKYGGMSVVDLTADEMGRDPRALQEISRVTGLKFVMGTGPYVSVSRTGESRKETAEEITERITREFEKGVGDTGIKPGIIGEIGISNIEDELEIRNLRASCKAQREIGCGMNIHQHPWETHGNRILDVVEEEKVDLDKVVLSHCGPTIDKPDYHDSLAKRGAFIEYDQFGTATMADEWGFHPCDGEKIKAIKEQIRRGNIEHVLISHDVCFKISLTKWGGWGYGHILKHIVSRFKREGITEEQINTIMVENPRKLLSF